ncbi:unnamed protein product [Clonostachys rosea]|uniref:Uncharacterized protein n=1 Tax=Bionectria ochroleuca TaxID=29856 RepID=A0ABY6U528_BIOOC|nr:unnamed protein product [Clonostachys rosea]
MPLLDLVPLVLIFFVPPLILYGLYGYCIRSRLRQRSEAAQATGRFRLRDPGPPIMRYFTFYRNLGMMFESRRDYVPVQSDHQSSVPLESQSQSPPQRDERARSSQTSSQRTEDPGAVV